MNTKWWQKLTWPFGSGELKAWTCHVIHIWDMSYGKSVDNMEMSPGTNLNNMFSWPITIINLVLSRYTCICPSTKSYFKQFSDIWQTKLLVSICCNPSYRDHQIIVFLDISNIHICNMCTKAFKLSNEISISKKM
jgi:hypothetical protein